MLLSDKIQGITSVQFVAAPNGLPNNPASAHRVTGKVWLNSRLWQYMTYAERLFTLLHEEGHIILSTTSETEADLYALKRFVALGEKPTQAITALNSILSKSPANAKRKAVNQQHALYYEWLKTRNPQALQNLLNSN
jgi:hypothetical protein